MEPVANSLQNTSWCTAIQVCLPHGNNCKTQNITRWLTAIQVSRPHGNIKPFKHTCMHIAIQISLPSGSNLPLVNRSQAKINRLPSEGKIPQHPIAASCLSEALNNLEVYNIIWYFISELLKLACRVIILHRTSGEF